MQIKAAILLAALFQLFAYAKAANFDHEQVHIALGSEF